MSRRGDEAGAPVDRVRYSVTGLGCVLALVVVVEVAIALYLGSSVLASGAFAVGALTTVPALFGITYTGYWLGDSNLDPARYPRIAGWCLGGLVAFVGLNCALVASVPPESWLHAVSWLRWAAAVGAGVGLLVGVVEARAIEQAIAAETAAMRTDHLEEQRDLLDYLNAVLRHEVLNTATAIDGYASRLLEERSDLDEEARRWIEIVIDESNEMTSVVDDVRVLLRRTCDDHELHRVDLSRVLADEVRKLTYRWPAAEVETSIPEGVVVRADDMLPRVFGNLLSNAVEHNDGATPRVRVSVDRTSDAVEVEVSDDGPGIPDEELDSLFERGCCRGNAHGLGLYLVRELVESYDGTVELVESGPDGTTFRVVLPRAPAEQQDADVGPT